MLLPSQLAAMKLGVSPAWRPRAVASRLGLTTSVPAAYSRIMSTPRVAGCNDKIGDCFPTACVNAVQTLLGRANNPIVLPDSAAVDAYEGMAGYNPAVPTSDQGTDPDAGFAWWQKNSIAGYLLRGLRQIAPTAEGEIRAAIADPAGAGGVLLCVELAIEQQNQVVWEPAGTPGSWGGHAIWLDDFDGSISIATSWGAPKPIERSFFDGHFVVAAFALDLTRA